MTKIYNLDTSELNNLNVNLAAGLLALSVDLTLIVNESGVIEKVVDGSKPVATNTSSLVGKNGSIQSLLIASQK